MNGPPIYIFDLDGTIALIDHRRPILSDASIPTSDARWRKFFAACVDDVPNMPVIETMRLLDKAGAEIWIFSGRSDEVQAETIQWLATYDVPHYFRNGRGRFFMRLSGDYTEDSVLKDEWFSMVEERARKRIVAAFDDRDKVVAMWRRNGIPCFQVAEGKF